MLKKITAFLLILSVIATTAFSLGQIQVGVTAGDWIEYEISTTGAPVEGHNIVSAKMEITEVQGTAITANVTSTSDNGTVSTVTRNFNLQEGNIQAWVIIPANLGVGDKFYDATTNSNITIQEEQQKTFAGATRAITHVSTPERDKQWDKATGVFVTTLDFLEGYTINATAVATNMWSPQTTGLDQTTILLVVTAVAVIIVAIIVILIVSRRNKH